MFHDYFYETLFFIFKKYVNFKVTITEMYPWFPWELVKELTGSVEQTLETTAPQHWSQLLFSHMTFMNLYLATSWKMVSGILSFLFCRKLLHLVVLRYLPNLCINFVNLYFAACHSFASPMALSSYRFGDVYKLHISVSM
jgi:hypothetical protein